MDIKEDKTDYFLSKKCNQHPSYPCNFIHIKQEQKKARICIRCIREDHIPINETLSVEELLKSNNDTFLETYPPLKDIKVVEEIMVISQRKDRFAEQIDEFFSSLEKQVADTIQIAKSTSKATLIKLEEARQQLEKKYQEVASIEEIKNIILSEQQNEEELLKILISKKCKDSESNEKNLKILIHQFEDLKEQFGRELPDKKMKEIVTALENINFFKNEKLVKITSRVNSVLSIPFNYQMNEQITQGYYDINLKDNYIITFLLNFKRIDSQYINNYQNTAEITIGLIPNSNKDSNSLRDFNLCYSRNRMNNNSNSNFSQVQLKNSKNLQDKIFVQINLQKKIFNIIDYDCNQEISYQWKDFNKISSKIQYYFGYQYNTQKNILKLEEVYQCENS